MTNNEWKVGDRIAKGTEADRSLDYFGIWYVQDVVERGLVVALQHGSHKHLMEWSQVAQGKKL